MIQVFYEYTLEGFCGIIWRWCIIWILPLRKKCPNLKFFWSAFPHIWTEYGDLEKCPNTEKCGPEKLQIRTLFTKCSVALYESELEEGSLKTRAFSLDALCHWWMLTSQLLRCTPWMIWTKLLCLNFHDTRAGVYLFELGLAYLHDETSGCFKLADSYYGLNICLCFQILAFKIHLDYVCSLKQAPTYFE